MRALTCSIVAGLLLTPASGLAFSTADRFEQSADTGGGGGRFFTGSPVDGFTCVVCHGGASGQLSIEGLPTDGIVAGATYDLAVTWPSAPRDAGFTLEIVDSMGAPAGALTVSTTPPDDESCPAAGAEPARPARRLYGDPARAVIGASACGASIARASWTAPAAPTPTLWLHAAAVLANGNGVPEDDPVAVVREPMSAAGAPPPERAVLDTGCTIGGIGDLPGWATMLFVLVSLIALRRRPQWLAALAVVLLVVPSPAHAVPGPDSVAVVANANVPESVALAMRYADERDLPPGHVCLLDLPDTVDITLADFQTNGIGAIETCLAAAGAMDRIEAVLLIRGLPLRVGIPVGMRTRRVSLAAALGVWRSENRGAAVLGQEPGRLIGSAYAASWQNPFQAGPFEPGFERMAGAITWRPLLVTMFHGYSYADAERLLDSALAAEEMGGADGEFVMMNGGDRVRGLLDVEYDATLAALRMRGYTDVARLPFSTDLSGRTLAAFFVGTASLGMAIEGNTFRPGALVDNVTSFGATPENFDPMAGQRQVSVARWVAMGVAGVHGTTDEPLAGVFPSRRLIVDYVDGSTLAEAYHRRLPNVYWRNLVLGDPMLAPYAVRPEVTLASVSDGDMVGDARRITVTTSDTEGFGVDSIVVLLGNDEIARADADTLDFCLDVPAGESHQLLVVAQKADDGVTDRAIYRPKGWVAIGVTGAAGVSECPEPDAGPMPIPDAGAAPDASADAGGGPPPPAADGGCGCTVNSGPDVGWIAIVMWVVLAWRRRRASS